MFLSYTDTSFSAVISTKPSTEAAAKGNAVDSNTKLISDSLKYCIRALGTASQSYSLPVDREELNDITVF